MIKSDLRVAFFCSISTPGPFSSRFLRVLVYSDLQLKVTHKSYMRLWMKVTYESYIRF